ncbi:hypothetical protein AB0B15_14315 [Streptomyces sp. NPDC045456]|uniref:hypothetical protein n=1 Tax=Streptomyces sp. NPDC045456 TaxID=3155254 RepID=UPI0033CE6533
MSVHMSMPADGTRTPEEDRLLEEMRRQTADRQAAYQPGRYTAELEIDCPASAVPELKKAVVFHGDRAVTVFGPLDITLLDDELDHTALARAVVGDLIVGLFGWDFAGQPCKILRFGAVPGHLSRMTDTVLTPTV